MKYSRILQFIRGIHVWLGLVVALYLALIAVSGVALNHRHALRLDDRYVSRTWVPPTYRPEEARVRADVALNDLRSGLLFGRTGTPTVDIAAVFCLALLASGFTILALGRSGSCERKLTSNAPAKEAQGLLCSSPRRLFLVASSKSPNGAKILSFKNNR